MFRLTRFVSPLLYDIHKLYSLSSCRVVIFLPKQPQIAFGSTDEVKLVRRKKNWNLSGTGSSQSLSGDVEDTETLSRDETNTSEHQSVRPSQVNLEKKSMPESTSEQSTVEKGTRYELFVINELHKFGFKLLRRGGAGDEGVDFAGHWYLPLSNDNSSSSSSSSSLSSSSSIPSQYSTVEVIGQCKHEAKRSSSKYVRELEGVVARFSHRQVSSTSSARTSKTKSPPSSYTASPLLGLLVSNAGFSKAARSRHLQSHLPLVLCAIDIGDGVGSEQEARDNLQEAEDNEELEDYSLHRGLSQFLLNTAAQQLLPDLEVGTLRTSLSSFSATTAKSIVLYHQGHEILPFVETGE